MVPVGGVASSGGDTGGVIAVGSCTGGGRGVQGFATPGLRCDLVRRYTPSVVLFLTILVLLLLSGQFLVPRSWSGEQEFVLAGLGEVV